MVKTGALIRAVIDTNVLISAILSPSGSPAQVVRFFVESGRLVFSEETFEEFQTRLWRPKFDLYISREMRQSVLRDFSNIGEWLKPEQAIVRCRDTDDDMFLTLVVAAKVDMLVSGDADLTLLIEIDGIPIVTPAQSLKILA